MDCFVAEFIIGPAEGGTRWLLAMTRKAPASRRPADSIRARVLICPPWQIKSGHLGSGKSARRANHQKSVQPLGKKFFAFAAGQISARGNTAPAALLRLRATVGQVFRFAVATGRADIDPTAALRGAIASPVVQHRAAIIEPKAFGGLLRAIATYEGAPETRAALELMALTFVRPGELRTAEWSEFDLDAAVWSIAEHHHRGCTAPARGEAPRRRRSDRLLSLLARRRQGVPALRWRRLRGVMQLALDPTASSVRGGSSSGRCSSIASSIV
jgi:integrase